MNRYKVHTAEGEYQAGSDGRVLKNLLGITSPEEMDEVELGLLIQLYESVLMEDLPVRALTVEDLKIWHRRWLGNVYEWAGQERSVNMGKGGFAFAAAGQIPRLLASTVGRAFLPKFLKPRALAISLARASQIVCALARRPARIIYR